MLKFRKYYVNVGKLAYLLVTRTALVGILIVLLYSLDVETMAERWVYLLYEASILAAYVLFVITFMKTDYARRPLIGKIRVMKKYRVKKVGR